MSKNEVWDYLRGKWNKYNNECFHGDDNMDFVDWLDEMNGSVHYGYKIGYNHIKMEHVLVQV